MLSSDPGKAYNPRNHYYGTVALISTTPRSFFPLEETHLSAALPKQIRDITAIAIFCDLASIAYDHMTLQ